MDIHATKAVRVEELTFDGFLIDMDGTLIDTTAAVTKHWADVGKQIGVDPALILETSHGRRSMDVLKIVAPEFATWDFVRNIESAIPKNHGHLAMQIPGAFDFLTALTSHLAPWTLVTSSSSALVLAWQRILRLPLPEPELLITAESVQNGKPDPACYILGREILRLNNKTPGILVVEDSPAGIRAGKAANCWVVGLLTSHSEEQIAAAGPDWIIQDLKSVKVLRKDGGKVIIELHSRA
ncbi:glycerol 3-phosphatase 1 [Colletotrichum incanum]|uniref:Glycerol 3-phosphatase 1 n=1 Tax=Colletotrichum incanum TaxID=1573173 RepID=A0A167BNZ6_COLIC|nr:glycerol 3-phosphatase 1 [Colletotrichum incanum]OHW90556.1 glycerol 3-phosphatase [Colletotrichum incanum]